MLKKRHDITEILLKVALNTIKQTTCLKRWNNIWHFLVLYRRTDCWWLSECRPTPKLCKIRISNGTTHGKDYATNNRWYVK